MDNQTHVAQASYIPIHFTKGFHKKKARNQVAGHLAQGTEEPISQSNTIHMNPLAPTKYKHYKIKISQNITMPYKATISNPYESIDYNQIQPL